MASDDGRHLATEGESGATKPPRRVLTVGDVQDAKRLWDQGKTAGEIADALGVRLTAITPWIMEWSGRA